MVINVGNNQVLMSNALHLPKQGCDEIGILLKMLVREEYRNPRRTTKIESQSCMRK